MRRRATIIGILAVWAVLLAALFVQDPRGPQSTPATPLQRPVDVGGAAWWSVYLKGHKVGFVHHELSTGRETVTFREESVLRLTTLGERQTIRTAAFGEMTAAFALRRLDFTLDSGPSQIRLEVTADDKALLVVGPSYRESIAVPGPIFLPLGLRATATAAPLAIDRVVRGDVFDPLTRTMGTLELKVLGPQPLPGRPTSRAWRIRESWRDIESILWVDEDGNLLREEGPMGLVAVREPKEDAVRFPAADSGDWDAVEAVALRLDRPIEDARTRSSLHVRLLGIPPERIPRGSGQSVDESGITIRKIAPAEMASYSLPYTQSEHSADLLPTKSIQSDHPRIRALTQTIVGTERDALTTVRLLTDWVYRYLRKVPTATLPDAIEVLDLGQGDCNEHAVLLAALCRAAGMPARVAGGLVYGEDAFLYHAWTDVWLGTWVPIDAALNQVPADATHVRLAEGADHQHLMMMGMVGNLSIEIVDVSATSRSVTPSHRVEVH